MVPTVACDPLGHHQWLVEDWNGEAREDAKRGYDWSLVALDRAVAANLLRHAKQVLDSVELTVFSLYLTSFQTDEEVLASVNGARPRAGESVASYLDRIVATVLDSLGAARDSIADGATAAE